ncbi:GerAB/ArcD/ProY family transporter [Pseudalkalibacillus berkeleyi]|uniref:Endospore germination permease n=1 Tax=Pseudalkalibacillus berkeleyi TaxID=1069813 RepID=A0ABS9GXG0_9BACL|nr:endospore germination permease [Pseudalkalibacillus berkeleyi]MCF6137464.1 endospore germination permease [Pseudalkalibacillus berkeleyi]
MIEKGKISVRQFTILVLFYTIGTTILVIPSILTSNAKQDVWIGGLVGLCFGALVIPLYFGLAKKYPSKNFAQILEITLGKWVGKSCSILYFFTFVLLLCVFVLRDIGDFMVTVMMVETPIQAIHISFLIVVIFSVRLGLEAFARAAELFLPWVILLYIVLVFTIAPQIDLRFAQPVLEQGVKPVLLAGFSFLTFPFLELVIFLMIIPYVNIPNKTGRGLFIGITFGGVSLIIISMLSILVVGVEETSESIYSSYDLAKQINIGGIFQRVEAMMAFIWFTTVFMKLTILTYVASLGLAQTFGIDDYKILTLPLGLLMYVLSINIFPNVAFLIEFTETMQIYVLLYGFVLPLFLWFISLIRKDTSAL